MLFRRDAFEQAGRYDETLPYAEDWELWMRMGRLGDVGNLGEQCVEKAGGHDTLSRQFFERQLRIASELVERNVITLKDFHDGRRIESAIEGTFTRQRLVQDHTKRE